MTDKKLDLAVVETLNQFNLKPLGIISKINKTHIKRPMNAFMVWSRSARKTISQNMQSLPSNQLSKTLGDMWNKLSYEQKLPFIEEANRLKQEHMQLNPGYKYQPRRKSKKIQSSQVINQDLEKEKHFKIDNENQLSNISNLSSNESVDLWPNHFTYYHNLPSCYSHRPAYYNQNLNENYFTSIFNQNLDHRYSNQLNCHYFNYDSSSQSYPYSPYSVNSSIYSIDSNTSN